MTATLRVQKLVKRFGALLVTDGIDLEIRKGEIHAIIGPNGAGKTTLIHQITGELSSDQGKIFLEGVDITQWPVETRAKAGLGRSYQITSIIPELSVLKNILLPVQARHGHNYRFWRNVVTLRFLVEEAETYLEHVGLADVRHFHAGLLSYGQQRQLELAMALAIEPKVLLLDEPMAGLGRAETGAMVRMLDGLRGRYAMLLVEHDMPSVFSLADQISVLVYGKVAYCGSPEAVRESAIVREAYLGNEEL